jgi:CheY-like chemotaxis protein
LIKPVTQVDLLRSVREALGHELGGGAQAEQEEYQKVSRRSAVSLRILLAEDNSLNQHVARGILEELGHTVTIANNGREVVEMFERASYDLVFMDIQMPEMNGYEATARIREIQQRSALRIPVIAMTAHAMSGDREKCLAAGMDDYISKPISMDQLAVVIGRNSSSAARPAATGDQEDPELSGAVPKVSSQKQDPAVQPISIDVDLVLGRFGGNRTLLQQVAGMFAPESELLLASIDRARAASKFSELESNAHTLKGMCRMFEVNHASNIAFELETAGRDGNAGADAQVELLKLEIRRAASAIAQLVGPTALAKSSGS